MSFIHHLRISVRDVDTSGRFYDPLMRALGFTPEPRDDDGLAWGNADREWLILTPATIDGATDDFAPGLHHVAFTARDRAHVDQVHAVLPEDSVIEPPSEYDNEPDHYAVFFRDPDGHKLEVVHVEAARVRS
jgi:glyoxylase I family protein